MNWPLRLDEDALIQKSMNFHWFYKGDGNRKLIVRRKYMQLSRLHRDMDHNEDF